MEYREYTGTISVNLSDMGKIVDMHTALLNHAETKYGQSRLEQHLAGLGLSVSAVIGYFSKIPGPTGKIALAAAAIAAQTYEILRAIVSSPFTLDKVLKVGLQGSTNSVGLARNLSWFASNSSKYRTIEFEAAFLEYTYTTSSGRESIRYIQSCASPRRLQLHDGTWISAS
ncbi:hypothetical protein [Paenibacillus sp. 843]|uniref:hypothetical protein n=1 Tax=Paenibacillus sp. 843 TaxID=3341795 RepID=UPI0037294753